VTVFIVCHFRTGRAGVRLLRTDRCAADIGGWEVSGATLSGAIASVFNLVFGPIGTLSCKSSHVCLSM
jgi:hypothetical protein